MSRGAGVGVFDEVAFDGVLQLPWSGVGVQDPGETALRTMKAGS